MPGWCWDMVTLWRLFQGGGMGAAGGLPNDLMEQPCLMIAAFGILSVMQATLDDDTAEPLAEDGTVDLAEKCRREARRLMGQAR